MCLGAPLREALPAGTGSGKAGQMRDFRNIASLM
jgi:hypothetical protein